MEMFIYESGYQYCKRVAVMEEIKTGDEVSFSQIFKFYYPKLYTYGVKLTPLPDLIRDQIQELFTNIWESRETLGDVTNIKAYLFVSLRRRVFARNRGQREVNKLDEISDDDTQTLFFENNEFLDRDFISSTLKDRLIENLNKLPVNQREIIFLKFFHQLTYREIAAIIDIKEQSVKNSMPKILQKLSEGLSSISSEDIKDIDIVLFNLFLLFREK
jgi:RNA polymerase sigma-70 factor (ECF subfamily)